MSNISIVINTWNSAETLKSCLESVKSLGEIIVMDMHSTDHTREIAREYTEHVYLHEYLGYVEPARNAAISKATQKWILVLDSDEEITSALASDLQLIAKQNSAELPYTHYFIPRKNLIFGKWVQHAGWWPDVQLRFFLKNSVTWQAEIHSVPKTTGPAHTFPSEEQYAIVHHHYTSVSQWIQRMDRYTTIQAREQINKGYQYQFTDNLAKPFSEFLRRFFVWEGYKDGIVGLNLSLLQSLSEVIVYLKIREQQRPHELSAQEFLHQLQDFRKKSTKELAYWLTKSGMQTKIKQLLSRII